MTYEEFATAIGKEVTLFLKKFHYDGKDSKDSFWVKTTQGELSWFRKYANEPYALQAAEIIAAVHNVVELETKTVEDT